MRGKEYPEEEGVRGCGIRMSERNIGSGTLCALGQVVYLSVATCQIPTSQASAAADNAHGARRV